jgi:hypothetical protein
LPTCIGRQSLRLACLVAQDERQQRVLVAVLRTVVEDDPRQAVVRDGLARVAVVPPERPIVGDNALHHRAGEHAALELTARCRQLGGEAYPLAQPRRQRDDRPRGAPGARAAAHDNLILSLFDRFDWLGEPHNASQPGCEPCRKLPGAADQELLLRSALDPGIALEAGASVQGEEEVEERQLARLGRVHGLGGDPEQRLCRPGPEPLVQPALEGNAIVVRCPRRVPRAIGRHLGSEPIKAADGPYRLQQREQADVGDEPTVGAPATAEREHLAAGTVDARRADAQFVRQAAHAVLPWANELPTEIDGVTGEVGGERPPTNAIPRFEDDGRDAAFDETAGGTESGKARPDDDGVGPLGVGVVGHVYLIDVSQPALGAGERLASSLGPGRHCTRHNRERPAPVQTLGRSSAYRTPAQKTGDFACPLNSPGLSCILGRDSLMQVECDHCRRLLRFEAERSSFCAFEFVSGTQVIERWPSSARSPHWPWKAGRPVFHPHRSRCPCRCTPRDFWTVSGAPRPDTTVTWLVPR